MADRPALDIADHESEGRRLKSEGRFEEAIAAFGRALEREPQNGALMTDVGLCLLELGRREEAAKVLGTAIRIDPHSARTSFAYGWAAENLGAVSYTHLTLPTTERV